MIINIKQSVRRVITVCPLVSPGCVHAVRHRSRQLRRRAVRGLYQRRPGGQRRAVSLRAMQARHNAERRAHRLRQGLSFISDKI